MTKTPEPRRPYHLGVAVGVTTGAYAISLMAASTLQIQHDRALIEDRQPVAEAIVLLGDHHDDMRTRLDLARARYAVGADSYGVLISRLDAMRAHLAAMDKTVTAIERANGVLAASIPGAAGGTGHAGSGSTGSSGSRGGSSGSGSTTPRTVPAAPPPVAQPPTSGSTGASGKP